MNITLVSSPQEFAQVVEPLLMKKESCNNLMLGIVKRLVDAPNEGEYGCLGFVEQDHEVVYAFMETPKNWILADTPNMDEAIISSVTQFLYDHHMHIPSIIGPVKAATMFVKQWEQLIGMNAIVHMEQLIYQLDHVQPIPLAEGKLIHAQAVHHALITQWLQQFGEEANEKMAKSNADRTAARFIANQSVYLWEVAGEPVSMVNRSRETDHGVTINAVYTPDCFKRKGYATSAVAALSSQLLTSGFQFCSLYTDKANPTSNGIYKKIGYYVVGDSIVYRFPKQE
ncbi:GNAT family N-acetyltransferase [Lentibacillus sp. N15]|uniref:GNAT family N-acetyltransferase n=1 Tax=Lentibacillus songyuanensis TaxID=3136161 RepID=UPI0031B9BF02